MKRILFAGLFAMLAAAQAYADEVKVSKAWTRATAPGQDSASVQTDHYQQKRCDLDRRGERVGDKAPRYTAWSWKAT